MIHASCLLVTTQHVASLLFSFVFFSSHLSLAPSFICDSTRRVVFGVDGEERDKVRAWFYAYIDMLHRAQLYNTAATICELCTEPELRETNKKSTTISITCPICKHASQHVGTQCKHCSEMMATCSLCQEPVFGIEVWCQGCGHGGHAKHMVEWFRTETTCPTGCLHKCVPDLVTLNVQPHTHDRTMNIQDDTHRQLLQLQEATSRSPLRVHR